MTCRGLEARQLAVAGHAAQKQRHSVRADLHQDRHVHAHVQHHADKWQRDQQRHGIDAAHIPAVALEAQDERQQIQAERQHPQQRNDGDLLGHLIGGGEQQHRGAGGEREPQRILPAHRPRTAWSGIGLCGGYGMAAGDGDGYGGDAGGEQQIA